jgi:hypothetical protein
VILYNLIFFLGIELIASLPLLKLTSFILVYGNVNAGWWQNTLSSPHMSYPWEIQSLKSGKEASGTVIKQFKTVIKLGC